MNILIVCKLLDDFTIYDSCLRLHVVLCALHELNYKLKVVILLSSFSLTTALSRFRTILDYHYNFTLNSIFQYYFGRNIELRVKISYVFNIVPYGI